MNRKATELRVGGLARLSTCDWPGELAATIFCQGCAWDCPYCHNPGLRAVRSERFIPWRSVCDFLSSRSGLLDGVVFSGGEPTLQPALLDAIAEVRTLGFKIGLHTAGAMPERFTSVLPLLDWVGFDVKASFDRYPGITGIVGSGGNAARSLQRLLTSGISYEVRTTVHPSLLGPTDMLQLKEDLLDLGVQSFAIQQYRSQGALPGRLPPAPEGLVLPLNYSDGFAHFQLR